MNIKQIVDKIIKEADVAPNEYTKEDRLVDIHQTRIELETLKRHAGVFTQKTVEQLETLIDGDQSFTKTFNHAEIDKIEYRPTGGGETDYRCLYKRKDCTGGRCSSFVGAMQYTENRETIYLWEALEGELRITYADDRITEWVLADYTTGTATPDELEEVYHKLLWLYQVRRHAGYYSKERYEQLMIELNKLEQMFFNELGRDADNSATVRGRHKDNI